MSITPPETVKIGAATYDVTFKAKMRLLGQTSNRRGRIRIAADQHPSQARDTLLHELIHAAIWMGGSMRMLGGAETPDDLEESICRLLAPQLLGIIRDNPDLIAYLYGDESETA